MHDAEDKVQETLIRAWRSYGEFQGRAYAADLAVPDRHEHLPAGAGEPQPPAMPAGLGGPSSDPDGPLDAARPEVPWLEPFPDALLGVASIDAASIGAGFADPAAIVTARHSMRLALIAALQYLPAASGPC